MSSNSGQELQLLSIERQQQITQNLYMFLLQKREENELAALINVGNTRMIMNPNGSSYPVAPNKLMILLAMIILGCGAPFAFFFIRMMLDNTIKSKADLGRLSVPFLAEIPNMIMEEGEPNYHMWLDLTNYMAQVRLISEELIKLNPENRDVYVTKTNEYLDELEDLQEKAKQAFTTTRKCVNFDEAIEYLKYDMNLDMYTVKTDHENNGLSAETVSNIIDYMKQNNIKIILTAKGSNNKNANVIAAETGAKIYQLDTQITGNIDKDEYITAMDYNIEQIKSMEE